MAYPVNDDAGIRGKQLFGRIRLLRFRLPALKSVASSPTEYSSLAWLVI
jgi:hypothetical protein